MPACLLDSDNDEECTLLCARFPRAVDLSVGRAPNCWRPTMGLRGSGLPGSTLYSKVNARRQRANICMSRQWSKVSVRQRFSGYQLTTERRTNLFPHREMETTVLWPGGAIAPRATCMRQPWAAPSVPRERPGVENAQMSPRRVAMNHVVLCITPSDVHVLH